MISNIINVIGIMVGLVGTIVTCVAIGQGIASGKQKQPQQMNQLVIINGNVTIVNESKVIGVDSRN